MTDTVKANCNTCGGERNAFVQASYSRQGSHREDPIRWETKIEILECCGCNDLSIRREFWFSEQDEPRITHWPPKQSGLPEWRDRLQDDNLCIAMQEVYIASNQGLVVLASIGVRTLLDRAFFLLLENDHGSFAEKLNVMVSQNLLLEREKEIFQSIADVGNAAAHRAHVPTHDTLLKILTAVESFLYQKFILPDEVRVVERETPSRTGNRP